MGQLQGNGNIIREKTFYKNFFALTAAIAFQNLLTYSVGLADNLMLGAYSEAALSGAALGNQIQFLLQMLVVGTSDGVIVIGSQYWGKNQKEPIVHIMGVALRYSVGITAVIFAAVFFFPSGVLGLLTNEPAVIAEGTKYLRTVCFSYLVFAVTNVLSASLRSVGIVKIGYLISGSTLCLNICLNYCLIYGNFGFPEMGIQGAATATLFSRCVEFLILALYLKCKDTGIPLSLRSLIHVDKSYYADYKKVSLPVLVNQFQWGIAQMVQTGVLGHLGSAAIAANSIAVIVFQILSVVVYGSAGAAGIVIGKTIGEGRKDRLRSLVKTLEIIFIVLGIISAALIFAVRDPVLMLYHISPDASVLARKFMAVLAVTTLGTAYQMSCDSGIIKGGGDTSFSAKLNFISMWGIVVPFSCIAAFVLHWPPVVVFILLKWDQLYKCIPVIIRLRSFKWVKEVTR